MYKAQCKNRWSVIGKAVDGVDKFSGALRALPAYSLGHLSGRLCGQGDEKACVPHRPEKGMKSAYPQELVDKENCLEGGAWVAHRRRENTLKTIVSALCCING